MLLLDVPVHLVSILCGDLKELYPVLILVNVLLLDGHLVAGEGDLMELVVILAPSTHTLL